MDEDEEWRVVEEAPGYKISSRGRLARRHLNWRGEEELRLLRPAFHKGYSRYVLSMGSKRAKVNRWAHTLVCTAFNCPKPSPELICAHYDGDRQNNSPDNLRWATHKENAEDRDRHGKTHSGPRSPEALAALPRGESHYARRHPELVRRGERHWRKGTKGEGAVGELTGSAKLTEAQVREILAEPVVHGSGRKLADKYSVSMGLITAIRKRRAWTYLDR